jgi:hypothetical protein
VSCGLDVGTAFLVAARRSDDKISFNKQRDAFFALEENPEALGVLDNLDVPYIKKRDQLVIVGEDALKFANIFKQNARRPLHKGVLSKKDLDAFGMLQVVMGSILGKPKKKNEIVKYTIPAAPINEEFSVEYHSKQLGNILRGLGYEGQPINEARCILLSELADKRFTGMSLSFGAGAVNVCLSQYGIDNPRLQFSFSQSGDWVDKNAAEVYAGLTETKVQTIKERGLNISDPNPGLNERELDGLGLMEFHAKNAIAIYYKALIKNVLKAIRYKFQHEEMPEFTEPITMVVAGGTSLVGNFINVFKQELKENGIGIPIDEVRHAKEPLYTVSRGALIAAELEERQSKPQKVKVEESKDE